MPFKISPAPAQPPCFPVVARGPACSFSLARRWVLLLVLCGILGSIRASLTFAQSDSPFAIRVDTREVIVPVVVFDRTRRVAAPGARFEFDEQISGLAPGDFTVFEDGVKQPVQSVTVELPHVRDVPDRISHHMEFSFTPRGVWSSPALWPQASTSPNVSLLSVYLVAYDPPLSSSGSCHRIQITVKRKHATVHARDEYCNVTHSLSDPIGITRLGREMEQFGNGAAKGELPVLVQVNSLVNGSATRDTAIRVQFPAAAIKRKWVGVDLFAMVAVLGAVRDRNGNLLLRFSDVLSTEPWNFYRGPLPPDQDFLNKWELAAIPAQYETRVDLPAAAYSLQLVITDGQKFGRTEVSVKVQVPPIDRTAVAFLHATQ